jgi:hypothetical protein
MVGVVALSLMLAFWPYLWWVIVGVGGILLKFCMPWFDKIAIGYRAAKKSLQAAQPQQSEKDAKGPGRLPRSTTMMSGGLQSEEKKSTATGRGDLPESETATHEKDDKDDDMYGGGSGMKSPQLPEGKGVTPNEKLGSGPPTSLYQSGKGVFYDSQPAPRGFFAKRRQNRDVNV